MVTVLDVKEPGRDVEGTVDTTGTITVTMSYEQMLGDIFGHRTDSDGKRNKAKFNGRERKIPLPRKVLLNSCLLEDTSDPQLAFTSESIPPIYLKTRRLPQTNET